MNWFIPSTLGLVHWHHAFSRLGWSVLSASFTTGQTSIFSPKGTPAHSIFGLSTLVLADYRGHFFSQSEVFCCMYSSAFGDAPATRTRAGADLRQQPDRALLDGHSDPDRGDAVSGARRASSSPRRTRRKPASALDVTVIGHQFWWEFRYPKLGIVTANELHVPVSDPKHPDAHLSEMSSADTDHSFWVPRLAGKMDLIPNRVNTMWIDPESAGLYLGQCAQYCGTQHAKMLLRVYARSPADFAAWVAHQQQPAVEDPAPRRAERSFSTTPASVAILSPERSPPEGSAPI